jgi:hypothetical protein
MRQTGAGYGTPGKEELLQGKEADPRRKGEEPQGKQKEPQGKQYPYMNPAFSRSCALDADWDLRDFRSGRRQGGLGGEKASEQSARRFERVRAARTKAFSGASAIDVAQNKQRTYAFELVKKIWSTFERFTAGPAGRTPIFQTRQFAIIPSNRREADTALAALYCS